MKSAFKLSFGLLAMFLILTASNCKQSIKAPEYIGSKNLKLDALSLTGGAVKLDLEFNNPNSFGISVKETNVKVYIEDDYIADAVQGNEIKVEANKQFLFPLVAKFNPTALLPKAMKWGLKKELRYKVNGTAKVGKGGVYIKVPVAISDVYKM